MKKKNKLLICILLVSFVQMATNGIGAILGNIQTYFNDVSLSLIQFLMTFPSLFIIVFTLLSAFLLKYFSKKQMIEIGLIMVCLSGIISFIGYHSLFVLYFAAAILGIGSGLCGSLAISLLSDYFDEKDRQKYMGWQTAAANFGSMAMTFFGGLLATLSWNYNYLVYFIALPGLIAVHFWLDNEKAGRKEKQDFKQCSYSFKLGLFIILFMVFFYIGPTSIAIALQEKGFAASSLAGIGTSIFLFGGVVFSLIFVYLQRILSSFCISFGILVLDLGFLLMFLGNSLVVFYLGCFIAGGSISFVMPSCMFLISKKERVENISAGTAIAMAASNVGTLIAPSFTFICSSVFHKELMSERFFVAIICCFLIFALSIVFTLCRRYKYEKKYSD